MESARPRVEERLCGQRADRLRFAIWRMCHRSATIRLSSLQLALISDAKFLLRRIARRFSVKSGNARPITMAGGWATTFSCLIMCISLRAREIDARSMANWVQMWKSISSRRIAAVLSIKPPIWQPEYFDRYLRSSENYAEKWHYVEQNAVRAGLVETVEAWPYRGTIKDLMF
jgi:hypothetical protein